MLFLALLAVIPLMGALFGSGNQVEQFSIVARLQDPGILPGDLYVDSAASFGPRIYYAHMLAWLNGFMPLPLAVHGLAVVTNFALAAVSYFAATRFFGNAPLSGAIAALFAVANGSFSLGLAGYLRFESFQPANIAIPLALIGLVLLVRQRWFLALGPLTLAALAHPLIGVEVALIGYVSAGLAMLVRPPASGVLRALAPAVVSGVVFAAAIYLAWVLPAPQGGAFRLGDAEFFDTIAKLRAPHHYLGLDFPRLAWLQALGFVAGTFIALAIFIYRHTLTREILALLFACLVVLALCAASLWFVDVMHSRLWITAQVFRMLMLVKWTGLLAFGWLMADWIGRDRLAGWVMTGCLAMASADAQPYAVGFVLLTIAALTLGPRWVPERIWRPLRWAGLVLLVLLSAAANHRYGITEQSLRAALGFAALLLFFAPNLNAATRPALASALVAGVLFATAYTRDTGLFGVPALRAQLTWSDVKGDEIDVARAAKRLSPPDAIWMVPPDLESFRLHANRSVVVDFKSFPFSDAAMHEWRLRIVNIYGEPDQGGFAAVRMMKEVYRAGLDWDAIARAYGATYAVLLAETPWEGPVLYQNDQYKAVQLGDAKTK